MHSGGLEEALRRVTLSGKHPLLSTWRRGGGEEVAPLGGKGRNIELEALEDQQSSASPKCEEKEDVLAVALIIKTVRDPSCPQNRPWNIFALDFDDDLNSKR